jgi:hypothetical protein
MPVKSEYAQAMDALVVAVIYLPEAQLETLSGRSSSATSPRMTRITLPGCVSSLRRSESAAFRTSPPERISPRHQYDSKLEGSTNRTFSGDRNLTAAANFSGRI